MSEKDVMNETMEGTMDLVEVPTTGNTLAKVVIVQTKNSSKTEK